MKDNYLYFNPFKFSRLASTRHQERWGLNLGQKSGRLIESMYMEHLYPEMSSLNLHHFSKRLKVILRRKLPEMFQN